MKKHLLLIALIAMPSVYAAAPLAPQKAEEELIAAIDADNIDEIKRVLKVPGIQSNVRGRYGKTALMVAADVGDEEAVELCLQNKAEINAADTDNGRTALMMAALWGHKNIVMKLLHAGADKAMKTYNPKSTAETLARFCAWNNDIADFIRDYEPSEQTELQKDN